MTIELASSALSRRRRPWLAALLSLICLGLGQLYNGEWRRAAGFFFAYLAIDVAAAVILHAPTPDFVLLVLMFVLLAASVGLRIGGAVDAFRRARGIGAMTLRRFQRGWVYVAALAVVAVIEIAIVPRSPAWRSYSIPSTSMMPTLDRGDYILAEHDYFQRHSARRGDLVIFRFPANRSIDYVKRVVALPGDRVALRNGEVYVNGVRLERQRVADLVSPEAKLPIPQFIEVSPDGRRYPVLDAGADGRDTMAEITVPAGRYFVLGDYRTHSVDSRDPLVGLVPASDLLDRPYLIFWSRSLRRIGSALE